jgi:hypothetical protein
MVYGYSIPKCDSVRREVFFYPREGRRRNGTEEKLEPWFSQRKSTVGELPEAANESECEDIDPPNKDARESLVGKRLRWVFAPYRPYPFFRSRDRWSHPQYARSKSAWKKMCLRILAMQRCDGFAAIRLERK